MTRDEFRVTKFTNGTFAVQDMTDGCFGDKRFLTREAAKRWIQNTELGWTSVPKMSRKQAEKRLQLATKRNAAVLELFLKQTTPKKAKAAKAGR